MDIAKAADLLRQALALLQESGPQGPQAHSVIGFVVQISYQGGLLPFGEKDQQRILIFTDDNQRLEFTFFAPGATGPILEQGNRYSLVIDSRPGQLDRLVSATKLT